MVNSRYKELVGVLRNIKERFGEGAFIYNGNSSSDKKVIAIMPDCAPTLEMEYSILKNLADLGELDKIAREAGADSDSQRRAVFSAVAHLKNSYGIAEDAAEDVVYALAEVFEYKVSRSSCSKSSDSEKKTEVAPKAKVKKEEIYEPQITVKEADKKTGSKISHAGSYRYKFDSKRYALESAEADYVKGMQFCNSEKYGEASKLFNKAYKNGNILAGVKLGHMYMNGEGVGANYATMIELFNEGEKNGYPLATRWLAEAYMRGIGVRKNKRAAMELYARCLSGFIDMCDSGDVSAQFQCGLDLIQGEFCDKNEALGLSRLKQAYDDGSVPAGREYAGCVILGKGCVRNPASGIAMLEELGANGSAGALYDLGLCYKNGIGVGKNRTMARRYFMDAASKGDKNAAKALKRIFF